MWILADIVSLGLAVILHASACRLPRTGNTVVRFLLVGSIVGSILMALLIIQYGLSPQFVAGVLVYAFLCELYIFLFTLAISSVSANLLLNLSYRTMTQQQVDREYDSSFMVTQRIDRMTANGLLEGTGEVLRLTLRGRRLLQMFERLRSFFRHAESQQELHDDS